MTVKIKATGRRNLNSGIGTTKIKDINFLTYLKSISGSEKASEFNKINNIVRSAIYLRSLTFV